MTPTRQVRTEPFRIRRRRSVVHQHATADDAVCGTAHVHSSTPHVTRVTRVGVQFGLGPVDRRRTARAPRRRFYPTVTPVFRRCSATQQISSVQLPTRLHLTRRSFFLTFS